MSIRHIFPDGEDNWSESDGLGAQEEKRGHAQRAFGYCWGFFGFYFQYEVAAWKCQNLSLEQCAIYYGTWLLLSLFVKPALGFLP